MRFSSTRSKLCVVHHLHTSLSDPSSYVFHYSIDVLLSVIPLRQTFIHNQDTWYVVELALLTPIVRVWYVVE